MSYHLDTSHTCLCTPQHVTKQELLHGGWIFVLLQVSMPVPAGSCICVQSLAAGIFGSSEEARCGKE